MAFSGSVPILHKSGAAAASLTGKLGYAAKVNSSGALALCTTQGEVSNGILVAEPASAGDIGAIMQLGHAQAIAGGTVAINDPLTVNSSSQLIKATSGEHVVARALEAATSGQQFQVFVCPSQAVAAAASSGDVKYAEVSLTAAEIKALNTTAKTLVAAPGAGYVLEFISAVLILDHGGTDYATNGNLSIRETNAAGTALSDTAAEGDFLFASADAIRCVQALSADVALLANKAMVLSCATGDPATGNGVLRVKVAYRIHTTGL